MQNENYKDLNSIEQVKELVGSVCQVSGDRVSSIDDMEKLQDQVIYTLQFTASVSENESVKNEAIKWINAIADQMNIVSGSNNEFYEAKSRGEHQFFTVPAINCRMMSFHMARAAMKAATNLKLPHIIFELALSESGYTGQQKDEYAALIKAGYISLGLKDTKVYLQADHYQVDPGKYQENGEAEIARVEQATKKAIDAGLLNIDIDTSKFETVDSGKSDRENQMENAKMTARILSFIRKYEKEQNLPCISVGGEVGEVGGENTRYPQVNAYLEIVKEEMEKLGSGSEIGLDKVSINVGSAHGGVLGPDGKPLDNVPMDFTAHHDLYMKGVNPMREDSHVITVQHGASTLPKHYFALFPAMHVAEVHLATGFQNVIWGVLETDAPELYSKMKQMVEEKFADKISKHSTSAVGFVKERKRVTEFVKRDLLLAGVEQKVEEELQKEFTTLFHSLYTLLQPKAGTVIKGDRED